MKISIAIGVYFLSLFQFSLAVALIWGVDSPIVVAIATMCIVGPLTYLAERSKPNPKGRILAWQISAVNTIFASMLAMYLTSRDINHYHAVFYALCVSIGIAKRGFSHAIKQASRIIAQGVVDTFKKLGWLDDE